MKFGGSFQNDKLIQRKKLSFRTLNLGILTFCNSLEKGIYESS
jgi:hypothetical protein